MENKMETTIVHWGYIGIMENKMETTIVHWGYIGIMENKMESTIVHWGYIGIMENKMETTIFVLSRRLESSCGSQSGKPRKLIEFPSLACMGLGFGSSIWLGFRIGCSEGQG